MSKFKVVYLLLLVVMFSNNVHADWGLSGRASLSGEVLASACSVALNDQYQSVSMGEFPLRDIQAGRTEIRDFFIRLDNCQTNYGVISRELNPPIRVRFDGLRASQPGLFRTQGAAQGVALQLSDERREVVMPGEYLPVVYQKAYGQQVLVYRIALVPDGKKFIPGDYSAALRFSINYE
ncbi:type 1 fimbrial protein [Escherichia coli]|nr:type 1 fimbrial protein [Shigella flexneri]